MDNGRLFVPTRHFHGDYAKEEEFFDHDVLSLNTKNDVRQTNDTYIVMNIILG